MLSWETKVRDLVFASCCSYKAESVVKVATLMMVSLASGLATYARAQFVMIILVLMRRAYKIYFCTRLTQDQGRQGMPC